MKNHPFAAGIAIVGAFLLASSAAAAQGRGDHDTPATQSQIESGRWQADTPDCRTTGDGWVMCRDDNGYWQHNRYAPQLGARSYRWQGYGYNDGHWADNRYGNNYGNYRVLAPSVIARNLWWNNYRPISRPVLSGAFYQVKAIDPRGRSVKLYVDAYSGQIVKSKGL